MQTLGQVSLDIADFAPIDVLARLAALFYKFSYTFRDRYSLAYLSRLSVTDIPGDILALLPFHLLWHLLADLSVKINTLLLLDWFALLLRHRLTTFYRSLFYYISALLICYLSALPFHLRPFYRILFCYNCALLPCYRFALLFLLRHKINAAHILCDLDTLIIMYCFAFLVWNSFALIFILGFVNSIALLLIYCVASLFIISLALLFLYVCAGLFRHLLTLRLALGLKEAHWGSRILRLSHQCALLLNWCLSLPFLTCTLWDIFVCFNPIIIADNTDHQQQRYDQKFHLRLRSGAT